VTDHHLTDLRDRAQRWHAAEPDDDIRAELEVLLAGPPDELAARFAGRLEFGTAGLRAEVGAGPLRMNRLVVRQAAAGLAAHLLATDSRATERGVVIGYDARRKSDVFANDTAQVMAAAGIPAMVFDHVVPTPLLAWSITELDAAGGVVVTASHNPPADNGYKVYLGDGSQIVPPADVEIASRIDAVTRVSDLPRGDTAETLGEEVVNAYLDAVAALPAPGPRDVIWVYTPMHGVGGATVVDVARRAGFPPPLVVDRQAEPDPEFPTMAFPNPEEPGAMDLAKELAAEHGADLLIANDPDADRCAVGAPTVDRGWRMLSGDEVGALLADHLLRRGVEGVYAASVVSSSLLRRLAAAAGQPYAETLTGFKWIARVPGLVFGYEEALGYCLAPSLVRDKDGISALVLVLELAAALRAEGRTLLDRLDEMALRHGVHATDQLSVRVADLTLIADAMTGLRATPPELLGGLAVEQVTDLAAGSEELPPTDGLRFRLAGGARVVVRPSGTEPKLKCYLEVVVPVGDDQEPAEALAAARIVAVQRLDAMRTDLAAALGL
jgi:phosphomannomutase